MICYSVALFLRTAMAEVRKLTSELLPISF